MNKLRMKMTWLLALFVGLSVLAAGLLSGYSYRQNHLASIREAMIRELYLIDAMTDWPDERDDRRLAEILHRRAEEFKQAAGMRVTYILPDGRVAGESDLSETEMDNHLDREEIRKALAEGIGTSIRRSESLNETMMYAALAVHEEGSLKGFIRLSVSLRIVSAGLVRLWAGLAASLLVFYALAAVVSYRAARSVTRPIEKMTAAAQRMSNMDYGVRVPEDRKDEIGALGAALNRMAENLSRQLEMIRKNGERLQAVLDNMPSGVMMIGREGMITLCNRKAEELLGISARERTGRHFTEIREHSELAALIREGLASDGPKLREWHAHAPEERIMEVGLIPMTLNGDQENGLLVVLQDVTAIRRLENMRSEFVANVSHELKTPVAAVKGFAETLLSGALEDKETARSFLTIIHEESERLNRLIGDLLELSKIESRRSPLQFSPVDFGALAARLHELFAPEAAKKGIALEMLTEPGLFLEADEDRLGQILINLLQNGLNYTPEGGRVTLQAETFETGEGEQRVRITVSDTGIGIPGKDLPRIFERFYRVDKARSRSSGGTGLGLSIVKHLVDMHGGTIRVESELGAGSRFIIELPLIQP